MHWDEVTAYPTLFESSLALVSCRAVQMPGRGVQGRISSSNNFHQYVLKEHLVSQKNLLHEVCLIQCVKAAGPYPCSFFWNLVGLLIFVHIVVVVVLVGSRVQY